MLGVLLEERIQEGVSSLIGMAHADGLLPAPSRLDGGENAEMLPRIFLETTCYVDSICGLMNAG